MSIADKILRAKADYDAVYEAGKASGGGSHTSCFDGTFEGEFVDNDILSLKYGAFAGCSQITKIDLPNCTKVGGNYAFYNATAVEIILLPSVTSGSFGAVFYGCSNVKTIDLRSLGGAVFESNAFRGCGKLEKLILGGNTICTFTGSNYLSGVPTSMTVYVPESLVGTYQGTSPWSQYEIKPISALEG